MARSRTKKTDPTGCHVTVFLDNDLKAEWDSYCQSLDINSSQWLRRLIRAELKVKLWEGILK